MELLGDLEQLRVRAVLIGDAVVLQLDEEVVAPEDLLESGRLLQSRSLVALQQRLQDLAAEAARRDDEALVVRVEQLPVDLGLHVVALEVGAARELDQVAVADVGLGQRGEVVVRLAPALDVAAGVVLAAPASGSLRAVLVGLVELGADDRLEAVVLGRPVEVEDAVHVAVVGDPDRRLAVGGRLGHHVADPRRPVEHRELGVQMQMGERVGHWFSIPLSTPPPQAVSPACGRVTTV